MPNYKGHLAGGFVAYIFVIVFLIQCTSLSNAVEWLCFTLLGSLFPDIDTKSKGQKLFYKFIFVVFLLLLVQKHFVALAMLSLLACIPLVVSHRGLCHKIWFVIGVPVGMIIYCKLFFPHYAFLIFWDAFFFCIGALSHLWLDLGFKKMLRL